MTQDDASSSRPALPRSRFLTVTAWVFILLACLALLGIAERSAVALTSSGPAPSRRATTQPDPTALGVPFLLADMPEYWVALAWAGLAFFGALLAASVGLLKRAEWARELLLVLLSVAAGALGFLALAHLFSLVYVLTFLEAEVTWARCDRVTAVTGMGALVISTAGCLGLIWVLWRLTLPKYKREFGPTA